MQITVDKISFLKIVNEWHENNLHEIHPLTKFFDNVGLRYLKKYKETCWLCEVTDQQKYMVAKIKYGI